MKPKENRSVPISFRLTESEFEPYKYVLAKTELTKTDFFRSVFLNKQYTFNVNEKRPVEYDRLLFLFNKTSNNINQIAHKLNGAYRGGIVSEKVYVESLNNLISIERLLKGGIDKC
ncbi:plasmid mobilization relaxosome protein MobC [Vibrio cyclitrophicus]